jgi:hypothetical protein
MHLGEALQLIGQSAGERQRHVQLLCGFMPLHLETFCKSLPEATILWWSGACVSSGWATLNSPATRCRESLRLPIDTFTRSAGSSADAGHLQNHDYNTGHGPQGL